MDPYKGFSDPVKEPAAGYTRRTDNLSHIIQRSLLILCGEAIAGFGKKNIRNRENE